MDAWLHLINFGSMPVCLNIPEFVLVHMDFMIFRNTIKPIEVWRPLNG